MSGQTEGHDDGALSGAGAVPGGRRPLTEVRRPLAARGAASPAGARHVTTNPRQKERTTVMFKSLSSSILALAVGIVALAWPGVTVLALVVVFAVYAFIGAGFQAAQAFSSRTAGPV